MKIDGVYSSFEEIDHDLNILRLQREIDKENLKLNLHRAKTYFHPIHLVGGVKGLLQKLLITLIAKKIANKLH